MKQLHRHAQAGFTMVELLVATLISSIILLAIYFVFISGSEQYYRQEQIVQMQEGMRFAMEYLKADLRNAGRLTVVNGNLISSGLCSAPLNGPDGLPLTAVRLYEGEVVVGALSENGMSPDRVRLLADVSGAVTLSTQTAIGLTVVLNDASLATTAEAQTMLAPGDGARFLSAYKPGYYLHIASLDSKQFDLVPIEEVNFAGGSPIITLARNTCMRVGECDGRCLVNPVQLVEYAVINDGGDRKSDLVRRVIDARPGVGVLGNPLRIAEFAVNLQVWGTYDSHGVGSTADIKADNNPQDDIGNWAPAVAAEADALNVHPERIRALNVLLAIRTPREDPSFRTNPDFVGKPADQMWFDLDNGVTPGYARVTTLQSEVETPNLNRGL